jgi:hypothetical protein
MRIHVYLALVVGWASLPLMMKNGKSTEKTHPLHLKKKENFIK